LVTNTSKNLKTKKPEPCEFGFPFLGYYVLTYNTRT